MNSISRARGLFPVIAGWLFVLAFTAMPALAAEEAAPDPAGTPAGMVFRWLNFLMVFGGLVYVFGKVLAPSFREHARAISDSIREASETRAAANRELSEATEQLSAIDLEIQAMRRAAVEEAAGQANRIRALAAAEAERVAQVGRAEIEAAERAARQELRAMAAQRATDRAAILLAARINPAAQTALLRSFVSELERSAS